MNFINKLKITIVGVVCFSLFTGLLFPASVQAQTRQEQLDTLSATLITIGALIKSSPSLTQEERISLYTQLVGVSNAILTLQTADNVTQTNASTTATTTPRQAPIRVIFNYDYDRPTTITATVEFASSTETIFTWQYPAITERQTFGSRLSAVRQYGTYEIAREYGITQDQARRLSYISARNPLRNSFISKNSDDANILLDSFGVSSVINEIKIYPGKDILKVKLKSDQNEILLIEMFKNVDLHHRQEQIEDPNLYNYKHTYFLTGQNDSPYGQYRYDNDEYLIVELLEDEIKKEEIVELLLGLFGSHPLAGEIDDYDNKLFNFMLENRTHLLIRNIVNVEPENNSCFDEADVLIVTELVNYLVTGMEIQHVAVDDSLNFVPLVKEDDNIIRSECRNVERFF